jgi:NosR/NirI family nitrous oxide reductase transcriptional regulator
MVAAIGLVVMMLGGGAAIAAEIEGLLAKFPLETVFPGADHAGAVSGKPPSAPVFRKNSLAGYVFLTSDVVGSVGFSGKPVKILAGLDLEGRITGALVVEHQEPILVLGIPDERLHAFTAQYAGIDLRRRVRLGAAQGPDEIGVDMVSGASITSLVFNDSIIRSARLVGRARGVIGGGAAAAEQGNLDLETFREADWPALVAEGSIRRLRLTNAEAAAAFAGKGKSPGVEGGVAPDPDKVFIDIHAALATPAAIGQNLLGFADFNALKAKLEPGAQVIFVAGSGFYSFRGYTYRKTGVFDRLQLVQGGKTLRLKKDMHARVQKLRIAGAPEFREVSLFVLPPDTGFNGVRPWRLEVLVERSTTAGSPEYAGFPLSYEIPGVYIRGGVTGGAGAVSMIDEDLAKPLWLIRWGERIPHIVFLTLTLVVLVVILFFQDWVARQRGLLDWLRLGFLAFTLVYIGWIANIQLSVINVLTFVNSLRTGFRWDFFLLVTIPFGVNERIWPLKYVIFLGLFALSLGTTGMVVMFAEVEPFKTSITLKFVRAWPFVAYAVLVLAASLFVKRVFCRYLCPLGASLAMPGKNHMFDWLKRRPQCGTECHMCALQCQVQAIHPNGQINPHECIYCLECQRLYYDDHKCPPMLARRKRREERARLRQNKQPLAEAGQ